MPNVTAKVMPNLYFFDPQTDKQAGWGRGVLNRYSWCTGGVQDAVLSYLGALFPLFL
jgi:hypothetical protein